MTYTDDIHQRSLSDLLNAERQLRSLLTEEREQFVLLLTRLAQWYDGTRMEELRRADPTIPKYWTAGEWQAFFTQPPRKNSISWRVENGNKGTGNPSSKEIATAKNEIRRLQRKIKRLRIETAPYQQHNKPALDGYHVLPSSVDAKPHLNLPFIPNGFSVPSKPLKYRNMLRNAPWSYLIWRRATMMLYLIAVFGLNSHLELDLHVARVEGLSFRSNSTKKPLNRLEEAGFVQLKTLRIGGRRPMALKLTRLTDEGRDLCQMMGWPPVESDWDRLIRLCQGERHTEHTLAVILFAMHSRARGWTVSVMPEVGAGSTRPDVRIEKDRNVHLVEVELGQRDKTIEWRNLVNAQGHVAFCAYDSTSRRRLVSGCKLAKVSGFATDLLMLGAKRYHEITLADPLWSEHW